MDITSLALGFAVGLFVGVMAGVIFFLFKNPKTVMVVRVLEAELKNRETRITDILQELEKTQNFNALRQDEIDVQKQTVAKLTATNASLTDNLLTQRETNKEQTGHLEKLNLQIIQLNAQVSALTAKNDALSSNLQNQKKEFDTLRSKALLEFETIANKLFEEKSTKFTDTNKLSIETLLNPLKKDIGEFKKRVDDIHGKDTEQQATLAERINNLIEQTNKVSAEANNLATALKGNAQKRGNWGEIVLERILETSGLTKDREYVVQQSTRDEEGKNLRPDVLIKLPDERVVIIDSKVSLIAYDKLVATEDTVQQTPFLDDHLKSTRNHIDALSSKNYDGLDASLDFTMMFIPIEPAYLVAIQSDPDLWSYAYSKRIVLTSPTNLMTSLKLISDLWRREQQNKNTLDIVKRGERLYEKFVGFTENFEKIGAKLKESQDSYVKH